METMEVIDFVIVIFSSRCHCATVVDLINAPRSEVLLTNARQGFFSREIPVLNALIIIISSLPAIQTRANRRRFFPPLSPQRTHTHTCECLLLLLVTHCLRMRSNICVSDDNLPCRSCRVYFSRRNSIKKPSNKADGIMFE